MPKVTLEAVFRETGLDKLGRAFDGIAQKMKRMADVQKSWGGGAVGDDALKRQFRIGAELDNVQGKIRSATKTYTGLLTELDKTTDPKRRGELQNRMNTVERFAGRELALQERLNKSIAEEGVTAGRSAMIRRGLRLGLGVLGVPATIAGIARGIQESTEQSRMVSPMAARMYGTSATGGPGGTKDFTEYSMRLRENIVDTGAAMAFSGRESIQLADTLVTMTGSMHGFKEALESARTLGLSPQVTTQLIGTSRRFGGTGGSGQMTDEKFASVIARGIGESGMGPRGGEFIQSIVSTMQAYSTRLPIVQPDTITAVIAALNSPAMGRVAPTLRGSGALQVTQGITGMMDDMSEAMIAVQTQIVSRNPQAYAGAARKYGMEGPVNGTAAYGLVMALKQEGIAGPDGMKLAGDTLKFIVSGQDANTRKIMESSMLRLPMPMINALEKGGFMGDFLSGKIGIEGLMKRAGSIGGTDMAMQTQGMAWSHLGSVSAAAASDYFGMMSPGAHPLNAMAEMMEESLPSEKDGANRGRKSWRLGLRGTGMMSMGAGAGLGATAMGMGAWAGTGALAALSGGTAIPLMGLGAAMMGAASLIPDKKKEIPKEVHHILEVKIHSAGDIPGVSGTIAKMAASIMGDSMKDEAAKSQEVGGMNSAANLGNDKYPTK